VLARTPTGPELLRSRDGGRRFAAATLPSVRRGGTGKTRPIRSLTFVDAQHGYAVFGSFAHHGVLLETEDGARSWHRVPLRGGGWIAGVAGGGGLAYAVTVGCSTDTVCHDVRLFRTRLGSLRWTRVPARGIRHDNETGGVGLAAFGASVWVVTGNGTRPTLLRSTDSARAFRAITPLAAVACDPKATSSDVVWLSCSTGMMIAFLRSEGSASPRTLPVFGSGTGNSFTDPLSDAVAVAGTAIGQWAGVHETTTAGNKFVRTGGLPRQARTGRSVLITFLGRRVGFALVRGKELLRTTDGGRTWRPVNLRRLAMPACRFASLDITSGVGGGPSLRTEARSGCRPR